MLEEVQQQRQETPDAAVRVDLEAHSNDFRPPNLFGGPPRERHVTFCVDTSGSMYGCLEVVKDHLVEVLRQHADPDGGRTFNLIEFSTEVVQWADRMVKCTPETVQVAGQWIAGHLRPKTGTNTVDAVVAAFSDGDCQAVYLVTDSVPDQQPDRAIDEILVVAGNRPLHCFYIQGGSPDKGALDFLREVATETYGSLHVITVAHHGAVERIAPIYRADMAADGIVRSTSGNVFSANQKMCSVTATIGHSDPRVIGPSLVLPPPGPVPAQGVYLQPYGLPSPPYPYCFYPWPYRYYCYYESPAYGWSRYRPAKAWINHAKSFVDSVVAVTPSAGAMLIGTRVLARRHSDGLFYLGSVKSQILHNKFLVEFGPCKHGRYKDTEYQETFVHDIVSHTDALRHPVLAEDKVLAPLEPDGERYAPGVVIDGQERRIVEAGGPDKQLVVAFHDGKSASIEKDRAVWIPTDLHERILFELNLPKNVRKEQAQRDLYPTENHPGYPTSGPKAFPAEFPRYVPPGWIDSSSRVSGDGGSLWYRDNQRPWLNSTSAPKKVSTNTEEVERVIPGTDLTQSQLNEKVMSQIRANETMTKSRVNSGSLRKNHDSFLSESGLKKSVSFADLTSKSDSEAKDSGHESQTDLCFTDDDDDLETNRSASLTKRECLDSNRFDQLSRRDGYDLSRSGSLTKRDAWSSTDLSLLFPRRGRRSKSAGGQRKWRYWKNDPAPSLMDPMHYGTYRVGPYKDGTDMAGLLRDAKRHEYGVEWTSPMSRQVDPWSRSSHQATVRDSMYVPRPPPRPVEKQGPGRDLSEVLGQHQRPLEDLADARRDFRQRQVLEREIGWQRRAAEEDQQRQVTLDLRRQQVQSHIERNQQRHLVEDEKAQRHLETRRLVQQRHLAAVNEGLGERERKEAEKLVFKTVQRDNRVFETAQRAQEINETAARRQATKELQQMGRAQAISAKVLDDERQVANLCSQKQRVQACRSAHFSRLENEAQRRKQLADRVADDAKAINRSLIII